MFHRMFLALMVSGLLAFGTFLPAAEEATEEAAPEATEAAEAAAPEVQPLTLAECAAIALANNPQLAAAAHGLQAAQARVGQAKAAQQFTFDANLVRTQQGPVVSFTMPDPQTGQLQSVDISPDHRTDLTINMNKVLYAGGRLKAGVRIARQGVEVAQAEVAKARQEVALRGAEAYLGLLKAQELRTVAEQAVAQAQEHLRLAQVNLEAGTVARYDVLRAEVEVANAQEQLVAAQNGVELAKAALNTAMGRPPDTPLEIVPLEPEIAPAPAFEESRERAFAQRPELAALARNIAIARESITVAQAGTRPTLALQGTYHKQPSTAFSEDYNWNVSVAVSMPIWDGGQARAGAQEARESVRQLQQTYELTRQAIELEVKQALLDIEAARQRIETTATAVTQAEESLRVARVRYEAGVSTHVELTDAELALTLARTNRVNALYDYALARVRLAKAEGQYATEGIEP